MAEQVLNEAIFQFQRKKLMEQIDEALAAGDKPLFFKLSAQYNDLLKKYGA
nr:IDEAL domain-containing protein [Geobacillus sp. T6]